MEQLLENYPPVLDVKETAKILGVTQRTIRHLVNTGSIASIRVGRLIRIPKDKLIYFINNVD